VIASKIRVFQQYRRKAVMSGSERCSGSRAQAQHGKAAAALCDQPQGRRKAPFVFYRYMMVLPMIEATRREYIQSSGLAAVGATLASSLAGAASATAQSESSSFDIDKAFATFMRDLGGSVEDPGGRVLFTGRHRPLPVVLRPVADELRRTADSAWPWPLCRE
jgi:hypothetical protein